MSRRLGLGGLALLLIGAFLAGNVAQSVGQLANLPMGGLSYPVQGFGPRGEFQGSVWAIGGIAAVGQNAAQPPQILSNDVVIGAADNSVPQSGPNVQAIVLRARQSLKDPTACRLVVTAGNAFGKEVTITDPIPAGTLGCPATP